MIYTKISEAEIISWLKNNLNEERFLHSQGTAEFAKKLAAKYNLSEDKAYIAGLLHDCAKCFSKDKLISIIDKNLKILDSEKTNPKTLHAPVSSYIAKTEFGIEDEDILSAIRWHTLGKINMTMFEKIIFLADKIETNTRIEPYCQKIRTILKDTNNIDKAILECYRQTIISLVDRNLKICPLTIDIYNELQTVLNT